MGGGARGRYPAAMSAPKNPMIHVSVEGLEALEAIADHGSFAAAAAALHKAQSAVSYAIQRLEDALDLPLFDRSGHRAKLTPAGVAILDEARQVLARTRRMQALAAQLRAGCEPRLLVVVDGVLPMGPIMDALAALDADGVPTRVQITTEFLRGVQRRFERIGADLMIVKDYEPDPRLEARALPDEVLVLVAAPGHPVHAAGPHDAASLQPFLEISVHDSADETQGLDTNTVGGGRAFYVSDFHTKRDAILRGLGYGWLPVRVAAADLVAGRLAEVCHRESSRWTLHPKLVVRRDRPLGPTGRRFVALVCAAWGG
jgi:DNA-binding transcriptional LysR family regulator